MVDHRWNLAGDIRLRATRVVAVDTLRRYMASAGGLVRRGILVVGLIAGGCVVPADWLAWTRSRCSLDGYSRYVVFASGFNLVLPWTLGP